MTVAGSVAIALAERVERTGGPRAGLVAWRALASNASDAETRAKALMAGIRCAVSLRDGAAAGELVALWTTIDRGTFAVAELCRDLVRAKMTAEAIDLAETEARRTKTAHALYTHARCLDVARDQRAPEVLARTVARAEKEGAARVADAARLRRAVLLARSWDTLAESLAEAAKLDATKLSEGERVELARVLLLSPSRFTRAGAIGLLGDVAKSEEVSLRLRARRLAARFADEASAAVTPLEHDRLVAMFDLGVKEAVRGTLTPAMEAVTERARDLLRGRYEVPRDEVVPPPDDPLKRRVHRHGELLDVVVAMRDGAPARAARSFRPLAAAVRARERLPAETLAVAHAALENGDAELRDVAIDLLAAWLAVPSYAAPPRGFLALADALALAGHEELAMKARRAAALRKENGAVASLATVLARVGWEASLRHDRPHAIALLREAKLRAGG
ncbi:MAG: hypothetical protein KIT84_01200 [Labilithrix sp.]|nr:hypothetical protein [Labilithrix sp.]MCW5809602.1 hypothetical protein [Labilithrix sp.]